MKPFLFGSSLSILVLILSVVTHHGSMVLDICGWIGYSSWLGAGIVTGAFVNGDRMRANFHMEDKEDRRKRLQWSNVLFLFGLPNVIANIVALFVLR
ncbi:hypothetical protein DNHGIG_13150 [Collibacillus ludicampi]|uniref:Uncharacterized protein n=1 Tax=Collibacillus ludicampi TaxID=2771369 RepID=A0AAV4LDC4_9BACL|nr:DUF5316 domain-containing protein [Collibacillus ludicampi]GIM45766.1 hypothetical protein DNHGIG_13150 [Collibacillus ludicampi]